MSSVEERKHHVSSVFKRYDRDNDGKITPDDLKTGFSHLNPPVDIKQCMRAVDTDRVKKISFSEFKQWFLGDDDKWSCARDGLLFCKNGCSRVKFGKFETCCMYCKGPTGPHANTCLVKSRLSISGEMDPKLLVDLKRKTIKELKQMARGMGISHDTIDAADGEDAIIQLIVVCLKGKNLKDLKEMAREMAIGHDTIDAVDGEDDPTRAVIQLIVARFAEKDDATTPEMDPKLLVEMKGKNLKDLKQMARGMGINHYKIDAADGEDDPKGAVIQLIVVGLNGKNLKELKGMARGLGIGHDTIDAADGEDDPRGAVIQLIVASVKGKTLKDAKEMARGVGISHDTIDAADGEDDPRGAVIQLIAAKFAEKTTTPGDVSGKRKDSGCGREVHDPSTLEDHTTLEDYGCGREVHDASTLEDKGCEREVHDASTPEDSGCGREVHDPSTLEDHGRVREVHDASTLEGKGCEREAHDASTPEDSGCGREAHDASTPDMDPKLLADLSLLSKKSLSDLKQVARGMGIGHDAINAVDDVHDPTGAVIQLIVAKGAEKIATPGDVSGKGDDDDKWSCARDGFLFCKNGCSRHRFGKFETCCMYCKGPKGPHANTCLATSLGTVKAKTMYIVDYPGLPVSQTQDRQSAPVGKLSKGSNVVVVETAEIPSDGRERARIVCPAGWISTKYNSYHYVTPNEPEGGELGTYIVAFEGLPVTAEHGRQSPQVARIPKDAKIEILEIASQLDDGRERARIAFPAGWISTKMTDGSCVYLRNVMVLGRDAGQLPGRCAPNPFDWIRTGQAKNDREQRKTAAEMTQHACADGCYILDGESVQLKLVQYMREKTCFLDGGDAQRQEAFGVRPKCVNHKSDSMLRALDCKKCGLRAVLVNAASAYQAGGGFLGGGRHALEESLCIQSTLFESLCVAEKRERGTLSFYIPPEKVVLSPGVEVFRSGTDDGYRFNKEVVTLDAVISMAMPNKNHKVKDAPVDAPADQEAYFDLLARKFDAMLVAAASVKATALVISAVGCGVYENDPQDVGKALGESIKRNCGQLKEIHLVGEQRFYDATNDAMA